MISVTIFLLHSLKSTFPYLLLGSVFLMKIRRFIFIVCSYFIDTYQKVYGYEKPLLNVNKTFPHEEILVINVDFQSQENV